MHYSVLALRIQALFNIPMNSKQKPLSIKLSGYVIPKGMLQITCGLLDGLRLDGLRPQQQELLQQQQEQQQLAQQLG